MFRRRIFWVIFAVVLLAAGATYAYFNYVYLPDQTSEESTIQTTVVRQGDITLYASGTGVLIAGSEVELGFGTSGTVAELNVQVGDEVKEGDTLAVQGDRQQLEASVAADKLSLLEAQQALDDIYAGADLVTAQAKLNLALALEDLFAVQYDRNVVQPGNRASDLAIEDAYTSLLLAEERLREARKAYEEVSHLPLTNQRRVAALDRYLAAQEAYEAALRLYNWYTGVPTDLDQEQLDAEVALAEANVAAARLEYERVKDGPDPNEIAKAELQITNAEAQLAVSQRNLDQSVITAPMDGTILSVNASVGQSVSGTFITLADLNHLYLEIYLDEADLGNIGLDYEVQAIFDALPDDIFTGRVTQINPSLYSTNQVTAVQGLARLDEDSTGRLKDLLLGMNAAVDVISGHVEGVALVPVEALRELSPGEYAVFVVEDGELKLRPVEVGLMDFTFAEIKSGLEVGEIVSTGIVETQ